MGYIEKFYSRLLFLWVSVCAAATTLEVVRRTDVYLENDKFCIFGDVFRIFCNGILSKIRFFFPDKFLFYR